MIEKTIQPDGSLLRKHIDELAAVQTSIQELHQEFAQLRNEARTDGFNMEAVQTLAQIIAKSPHDGGLGLVRDIVKYAHEIGLELDTVPVEVDVAENEKNNTSENHETSVLRQKTVQASIDNRLVFLTQLGLGLGIAWMFISLLG